MTIFSFKSLHGDDWRLVRLSVGDAVLFGNGVFLGKLIFWIDPVQGEKCQFRVDDSGGRPGYGFVFPETAVQVVTIS